MSEYEEQDDIERTAAAARSGTPDPEGSLWDSDDALNDLRMERTVRPDESSETLTKRMIMEAGPTAAASIIHIAMHSGNDNTRFNAAKYIVDKMYDDGAGQAAEKWEELVADVIDNAELLANSAQHPGTTGE